MAEASCPCGQLMSTADISSFVDQYVDVKSREVYERLKSHLDGATVRGILDGLPGQIRKAIDSHEFDRILVRDVADGRVYRIFVQNGLVSVQREGQLDDREGDSLVELACHCGSDGSGQGGQGGDSSTSKATLVFLDWDGSVVETRTVGFGEDLGELPTPNGRKGHQFKGWVQDGYLEATSRIGSVFTYRARYQREGGQTPQVATFHSVAFVDWDARSLSCVTVGSGEKLTQEQVPADPVREGHVFTGWVDSGDGSALDPTSPVSESHVYVPSWTEAMCVVSFVYDDGSRRQVEVPLGGKLLEGQLPANPTREGHEFLAWVKHGTDEELDLDAPVLGDLVYIPSYRDVDSGDVEDGGVEDGGVDQFETLRFQSPVSSRFRKVQARVGEALDEGEIPSVNPLSGGVDFAGWIDQRYGVPVGQTNGRWGEFGDSGHWYEPGFVLDAPWGDSGDAEGSGPADSSFDPAAIDEWRVMGDCEGTYASLEGLNAAINGLLEAHAEKQYLATDATTGRIYHSLDPRWQWMGHYVLSGGFSVNLDEMRDDSLGGSSNVVGLLRFDGDEIGPGGWGLVSNTRLPDLWNRISRRKAVDDSTYQAETGDFIVQEHEGRKIAILYVFGRRVWPRFKLALHDESGEVWKTVDVPQMEAMGGFQGKTGPVFGPEAWDVPMAVAPHGWTSLPLGPDSSDGRRFLCWRPALDGLDDVGEDRDRLWWHALATPMDNPTRKVGVRYTTKDLTEDQAERVDQLGHRLVSTWSLLLANLEPDYWSGQNGNPPEGVPTVDLYPVHLRENPDWILGEEDLLGQA